MTWARQCQVTGVKPVSAADTVLTPAVAYNEFETRPRAREDCRMPDPTIEVNGLRKRFGPILALDGMTFTVQPGQVTGFVGPNGAGKPVTGL